MLIADMFDLTSIEAWGKLIALIGIPSAVSIVAVLFGVRYFTRRQDADIKRDAALQEANAKRDIALQEASARREEQMARRIRQLEDSYKTDYIAIIKDNQELIRTNNELGSNMITTLRDIHKSVENNSALTNEVLKQLVENRCQAYTPIAQDKLGLEHK